MLEASQAIVIARAPLRFSAVSIVIGQIVLSTVCIAFFWNAQSGGNADLAQIVSAAVVEYIRSMGVDTKIFALASQAGPSELITPSHEVLLALNVVNDGRKSVTWTIETLAEGMYLKGAQETAFGMNKFMLTCPAHGPMYLYAIFDAGQNAEEVMTWSVNWLFIDKKEVRIDNLLWKKANDHGHINLFYAVNSALLNEIAGAKKVGVGLQKGVGGAVFSGFSNMPFEGGAAKCYPDFYPCAIVVDEAHSADRPKTASKYKPQPPRPSATCYRRAHACRVV